MEEIMRRKLEYNNKILYADITKENVKLINSYEIEDEKEMLMFLSIASIYPEYKLSRKRKDLVDEWKCHNLAYKLHFMRNKTKDTDLAENEGKKRLFLYKLIGKLL